MLVMTSGNIHDEPIVIDDEDAYEKLFGVADAFLGHNRAIRARYDDSVVRVIEAGSAGEAVQFIRRARGYAPLPLALPPIPCSSSSSLFATGPEQKNTFALTRDSEAFVSQHIGDLENAETYDAWLQAKNRYETLFEIEPTHLVCDLHPEYLASKWAREQSEKRGLPLTEVQHHQAHIVSVMGEHGLAGPVCGIAFDGTGYGMDGAIWGGEVLLSNLSAFERFANFAYVPMPGGAAAVKHPLRMAYGVLWAFDLLEHPGAQQALAALGEQAAICEQMIDRGINTPMTSSVGRLFDAASALLGVCTEPTYEGEPAILLEAAIRAGEAPARDSAPASPCAPAPCAADEAYEPVTPPRGAMGGDAVAPGESVPGESAPVEGAPGESASQESTYPLAVVKNTATSTSTAQDTSIVLFDAAPTFAALLDDLVAQVPTAVIARRFHDAFVQAIVMAAELVRSVYDINTVALSGGVFMNRYLLEHALAQLESAGFTVAVNRDLPPNDGCISFGQAVVAWASNNEEGEQPCA